MVLAVLAVLIATAIRLALDPWLGDEVPYGLYFLAIAVVAQLRGFAPALFTTLLSGAAVVWFFLAPRHSILLEDHPALAGLAVFFAIGVVIFAHIPLFV